MRAAPGLGSRPLPFRPSGPRPGLLLVRRSPRPDAPCTLPSRRPTPPACSHPRPLLSSAHPLRLPVTLPSSPRPARLPTDPYTRPSDPHPPLTPRSPVCAGSPRFGKPASDQGVEGRCAGGGGVDSGRRGAGRFGESTAGRPAGEPPRPPRSHWVRDGAPPRPHRTGSQAQRSHSGDGTFRRTGRCDPGGARRSVDNGFRSTRSQRAPGRPEGRRASTRRVNFAHPRRTSRRRGAGRANVQSYPTLGDSTPL